MILLLLNAACYLFQTNRNYISYEHLFMNKKQSNKESVIRDIILD